ncbi:hypothetical protein DSO57_1007459 [Entomophthora muscae]|uniref:Uncharacterized protein n=1 Tax=Entomophthora muscae TaxID=34485 RepID=A0ACC2SW87_9FUNG|nr:hypothetical protein DSO57_1007459 [Entomophthora muscae]
MAVAAYRWLRASPAQRRQVGSWLKFVETEYGLAFVEETRLFGKVVVMFMPVVFFWTMLSQCGTEWQNQYERMNKQYLGVIPIPTEASSNIGAILISVMVPSLVKWVYPFLERRGMDVCLVNRMVWGFFFLILGVSVSTCLNYYVDAHTKNIVYKDNVVVSCEGCVNGAWQLPQWFLMALAESLLCPSGIHLCYTQVGKQLKASSFSIFLLSASIGNYLIILIDGFLKGIGSPTNRQWIYLAITSLAFLAFLLLGKFWYVSKETSILQSINN